MRETGSKKPSCDQSKHSDCFDWPACRANMHNVSDQSTLSALLTWVALGERLLLTMPLPRLTSLTYFGIFTLLPLLTGEWQAHHGAILNEATRLAEAGQLLPTLDDRRFTLSTACDAYHAVKTGTGRGKMVVEIEARLELTNHRAREAAAHP